MFGRNYLLAVKTCNALTEPSPWQEEEGGDGGGGLQWPEIKQTEFHWNLSTGVRVTEPYSSSGVLDKSHMCVCVHWQWSRFQG